MVWLLPGADVTRLQIIIILTYIVALGGFFAPTLLGNVIGGVSLVAPLNFAQVASETIGQRSNRRD